MEEIKDRLRKAIVASGLSIKEVSEKSQIPYATLQKYLSGTYKPHVKNLQRLVRVLQIDIEWLLTGKGTPKKGEDEYAYVARVDAAVGAGQAYELVTEEVKGLYAFRRDWLARKGNPENMRLVTVYGDSMSPTLEDGDIVLVDLSRRRIVPGGIYAIRIEDGLMVKRLHPLPGGRIRIISDNPSYAPIEVDPGREDFEVIGKVLWAGRDLER